MSKIYEMDNSLFNKVEKIGSRDKFIFTDKHIRSVVVVDNTNGDFYTEDFSNKIKGFIYLVNDNFLPNDVEKEYQENKNKYSYNKYRRIVCDSTDYFIDRSLNNMDFLKFDPKKSYEFEVTINYNRKRIKSNIKDALGLAINYETELYYNNNLLISPLVFSWEENHKLIERYVGRENLCVAKDNFGWNIPYRNINSPQIEWLEEIKKEIKI